MSRIHEALKRAADERNTSQAAETITLALEPPRVEEFAGNGASVKAAGTLPRTAMVTPHPLQSPHLRFDSLVARCAREWRAEPNTNVFSNPMAKASGAEQFRTLRSRLYQIRGNQPTYTLLVTSSLPNEGKTFVTTNLAQAIVQKAHQRVLLIDADLRYPQLHLALGAPLAPGLTDYLRGEVDELAAIQHGNDENLCIISGGNQSANPSELLSNGRFKILLERLTPVFDWVILDSSPCLPVADASMLADLSNGVLLVVRAGSTPADVAQKVCQHLKTKNVIGVVLNGADENEMHGSQYYGYGYGNSTVA
jgi:protein-tyrosine kinase